MDREYKNTLSAKDSELAQLREQLGGMQEGFQYLSGTLMGALPEEDRARIENELRERQLKNLTQKVQQLERRPQTQQVSELTDDMNEVIERLRAETQESLEDVVKSHGLDPKDKGLDFGADEDSFPERLKKLNRSINQVKKAKDDEEVEAVKQKVPIAQTRISGGADPSDGFGKSFLERGADEVWERIQRNARNTKKV